MLSLLKRIHHDERGATSLETVLVVGAIALPILIFVIRFGWPAIRGLFTKNLTDLENNVDRVIDGSQ